MMRGIPRENSNTCASDSSENKLDSAGAPAHSSRPSTLSPGLFLIQRKQLATQRHPLQLAQFRRIQLHFQFRLPHQNDLQQLLLRGFKVRQQLDFLQQVGTQRLGFVDHQRGNQATSMPLIEIDSGQAAFPSCFGQHKAGPSQP